MKNILLFLLTAFSVSTIYGQETLHVDQGVPPVDIVGVAVPYEPVTSYGMATRKEKPAYEQTVYWEKHKKLKKYAFSTLGLGVCGTIVGWIGGAGNNAHTNSNWKNDGKAWDVVLGIGIGLTISSIPLFAISHKNKKRLRKA